MFGYEGGDSGDDVDGSEVNFVDVLELVFRFGRWESMYNKCLVCAMQTSYPKSEDQSIARREKSLGPLRRLFKIYGDSYNLLFAVGSSCCRRTRPYR